MNLMYGVIVPYLLRADGAKGFLSFLQRDPATGTLVSLGPGRAQEGEEGGRAAGRRRRAAAALAPQPRRTAARPACCWLIFPVGENGSEEQRFLEGFPSSGEFSFLLPLRPGWCSVFLCLVDFPPLWILFPFVVLRLSRTFGKRICLLLPAGAVA